MFQRMSEPQTRKKPHILELLFAVAIITAFIYFSRYH